MIHPLHKGNLFRSRIQNKRIHKYTEMKLVKTIYVKLASNVQLKKQSDLISTSATSTTCIHLLPRIQQKIKVKPVVYMKLSLWFLILDLQCIFYFPIIISNIIISYSFLLLGIQMLKIILNLPWTFYCKQLWR